MLKGSAIKLSPGKTIEVEPLNGRLLKIDTSSVAHLDITYDEEKDHILSISIEGKYTISLGDKFSIPIGVIISVYEIKYMIVEKGDKSILLFSSLPTKVSKFLIPLLNKSKRDLRMYSYFVNAYLNKDLTHLLLIYRFTGTDVYKEFESEIMNDPLFINHFEYDNFHVVYKFKIPDEFENDIYNFINGKYSSFSKKLKRLIQNFYGKEESSNIMSIVNRTKERRKKLEELIGEDLPEDTELESKPILKLEIYE